MQQTLRHLIADGKTKQAIAELRKLSFADNEVNNQIIQLAASFSTYEKQLLANEETPSVLRPELQRINKALLVLIDSLEDNTNVSQDETSSSKSFATSSTKSIEIILEGSYKDFDKQRFAAVVSAYLGIPKSSVKILQVVQGSIIIRIEIPSEEADNLVFIFENNQKKLDYFNTQLIENGLGKKVIRIKYYKSTSTVNESENIPTSKQDFSWTKWTGLNDVKSWVALFAGLAGIMGFYFNFCGQKISDKNKLTNVSVVVEDQNHDLIPAFHKGEDAFVLMTVEGGDTKEEVIDYKGTASFKNVKVGDMVRLKVKFSEPYRPSHPDSVYTIPSDGRLTLTVALQNLGRVFGTVIYRNAPLEGVLVDAEGFRDTTDLTGRFDISIPENARRKEPEVKFLKKGFKMSFQKAHPQTDTPLNIVMEK